jgi:hypothetical protein
MPIVTTNSYYSKEDSIYEVNSLYLRKIHYELRDPCSVPSFEELLLWSLCGRLGCHEKDIPTENREKVRCLSALERVFGGGVVAILPKDALPR